MENITDALKMAGAAMLFIIAFSITIMLFTKARQTTDAVLDNLKLSDFFPKVEALEENTTREVGIETIIPTLYRYCQADDNIRIRILDTDGNELQVFDQEIESLVLKGLEDKTGDTKYYNYLKNLYDTPTEKAYMFGAPWADQNKQYYLERINAYIYGTKTEHMRNVDYTQTPYRNAILTNYKDKKFEESYLEYRTNGIVYTDNYGEEIVMQHAETKVIITYRLKKEI